MPRYDLQVHTDVSPCSRASPASVVRAARRAGLDGIAVTNHDTLDGVAAVRAAAPDDLDVVAGVEVTTTQGHLLALGVERAPPAGEHPLATIEAVHAQGGVAVLSHPFDRLREHYDAELPSIAAAVDAVEGVNSRCVFPRYNRAAKAFARDHGLPVTGGSDAHFGMEVGRAYTTVPDGRDLLAAVREAATEAGGRGCHVSGHVATKVHQALSRVGV